MSLGRKTVDICNWQLIAVENDEFPSSINYKDTNAMIFVTVCKPFLPLTLFFIMQRISELNCASNCWFSLKQLSRFNLRRPKLDLMKIEGLDMCTAAEVQVFNENVTSVTDGRSHADDECPVYDVNSSEHGDNAVTRVGKKLVHLCVVSFWAERITPGGVGFICN